VTLEDAFEVATPHPIQIAALSSIYFPQFLQNIFISFWFKNIFTCESKDYLFKIAQYKFISL